MIAERARVLTRAYVVSDLAATAIALLLAQTVRHLVGEVGTGWLGPVYPFSRYLPLLALVLPLWGVVFTASGLYGRSSSLSLRTELSRVVRAVAISGLVLGFVIFALKLTFLSRVVIVLFLVLDGMLVVALRGTMRAFALGSHARRHIVVAGDLEQVLATTRRIDVHRDWGLAVIGLASDGSWRGPVDSPYPVLGTINEIPRLVHEHIVDEVIVAPAPGRLDLLPSFESALLQLEEIGIVVRLVVNFLPRALSDVSFDDLGGVPLLTFSTGPRNELLLLVRRCADVLLASLFLAIMSPLYLAIGLVIKLSSAGPVLFRQRRCGLNGRPFTFLKFRSMRLGADALKPSLAAFNEMDGPAFKMTNDPRVTPVGQFLRRTSLDELPQVWNILRGDMSFVGPRPAVLEEVAQYEPWQRRRLSMKPGLTCLWQVSGRNELSFDEWMRLDLEYIDNWSLWLDVKIVLKTVPAVLLGRGAR